MIEKVTSGVALQGDLVQLLGMGYKSHFIILEPGRVFETHRGIIKHDDIIGKPWGTLLHSHQGNPFYVMQPGLADIIKDLKRNTQIMYTKDIGYVLMVMGIGPGKVVLEAGTGSGALTCAFAYMVGDTGQVISYDQNADIQKLAKTNLSKLGLEERVIFKHGNASDGFSERNVDAIFLDLQNPFDYLQQARESLKPGGFFGSIMPTMNQVSSLIKGLKYTGFAFIEVCEVLLRFYKTDWERLRPTDRMVAHTGFLVFGRSILTTELDVRVIDEDEQDSENAD